VGFREIGVPPGEPENFPRWTVERGFRRSGTREGRFPELHAALKSSFWPLESMGAVRGDVLEGGEGLYLLSCFGRKSSEEQLQESF